MTPTVVNPATEEACDLAIRKLPPMREHGGSGIVDLTVIRIGRRDAELPRIPEETGMHIMVGCGFYTPLTPTGWRTPRWMTSPSS